MDIKTGRTYATQEEAIADGASESDIAFVTQRSMEDLPIVQFASGPFKNRQYKRHPKTGQLVRVK